MLFWATLGRITPLASAGSTSAILTVFYFIQVLADQFHQEFEEMTSKSLGQWCRQPLKALYLLVKTPQWTLDILIWMLKWLYLELWYKCDVYYIFKYLVFYFLYRYNDFFFHWGFCLIFTSESSAVFFLPLIFYRCQMQLCDWAQWPRAMALPPSLPSPEPLMTYRDILDATSEKLFINMWWMKTRNADKLPTLHGKHSPRKHHMSPKGSDRIFVVSLLSF